MTQNKNLGRVSVEDAIMDDTEVGTTVAHAIAEGLAMSDDGNAYASAQDAVDAAQNWVWLPPNTTFNESVTISTADLSLKGSGYTTLIDGGSQSDGIVINATDITISNLSVRADSGSGNRAIIGGDDGGDRAKISSVSVRQSGGDAIRAVSENTTRSQEWTVTNCIIEDADSDGIIVRNNCIVTNNIVLQCGNNAIWLNNDGIIAHNICLNSSAAGVKGNNHDNILIGNRVHNCGEGATVGGSDNIVANNRLSDNGNDIQDSGTGTVLDSNLTGSAN